MFYIWHTLLIAIFVATAFGLGYKIEKKTGCKKLTANKKFFII